MVKSHVVVEEVLKEVEVNITAVTVAKIDVDIIAQSVGNLKVDIAAQSIGNLAVNIKAAEATVTVTVTGDVYVVTPSGKTVFTSQPLVDIIKFNDVAITVDAWNELFSITGKGRVKQVGLRIDGTDFLNTLTDKKFRLTVDGSVSEFTFLDLVWLTGGFFEQLRFSGYGFSITKAGVIPVTNAGGIKGFYDAPSGETDYIWIVFQLDSDFESEFKLEFYTGSGSDVFAEVVVLYGVYP